MSKLKFISLNVRGLHWLSDQKADICFLSETFITADIVNKVNNDWTGICYHTYGIKHAKGASRGVSILVKKIHLSIC